MATSLMALALSASPGVAAAQVEVGETEAVIVTGAILRSDSPGSNFVISRGDLDAVRPLSVKDVLRLSPGVQVVDEDIFGLKLNISLRGLPPRRSGRTLLLEDGMPILLRAFGAL
ncbi:TonB-dependent receptor plug domain-containing protein [Caulobacter sp. B11]|uniref:TonB-dependent receptor plug domain-containing protein n=1 Tax=Caulobacter sp. B11 TaxID=2048899 RepID=UPI001180039C|nr:TonB-dependent receptor plug domain-containing protein [Caulobacter sp. B11]